jgi:hypothetical protein
MANDDDLVSSTTRRFHAQLTAASAVSDERDRAQALIGLIHSLSDQLEPEPARAALAAACAIADEDSRRYALTSLIPHLPDQLEAGTAREALSAISAFADDYSRARALIKFIPHLSRPSDSETARAALIAAGTIADDSARAQVLLDLIPRLPDQLDVESARAALAAIRAITRAAERARALTSLAPHMPNSLNAEVAREALASARAIKSDQERVNALNDLIPYLPDRLEARAVREVQTTTRAIENAAWERTRRLSTMIEAAPGTKGEEITIQQSGGVDVHSDTTTIGGDVVGRDKITYINAPDPQEVERQRRVEATFPAMPRVDQSESLYVQVKMPSSPVPGQARQRTLSMPFRADRVTGAPVPTTLTVSVIAPDCRIYGEASKRLRVQPDEDSSVLEFQLKCQTARAMHLQVEIYAESGFLGQLEIPVRPVAAPKPKSLGARLWNRGIVVLGGASAHVPAT